MRNRSGSGTRLRHDAAHEQERQRAAEELRPPVPQNTAARRQVRPAPRSTALASRGYRAPRPAARALHSSGKTRRDARLLAWVSAVARRAISRPQAPEPHAEPHPNGSARALPPPLGRRGHPRVRGGSATSAACGDVRPGDDNGEYSRKQCGDQRPKHILLRWRRRRRKWRRSCAGSAPLRLWRELSLAPRN